MKRAYLMTVIDGVFCVGRACYEQTRDLSIITLNWSEIMGRYNTAGSVVRDMRRKWVVKQINKQYCF